MSPEQLQALPVPVDRRTDIYSLGASLYEAVTCALPFQAESDQEYIRAVSSETARPARALWPPVPLPLERVLGRCLEREPGRRYQSASELRTDLIRFLETPDPDRPPGR
jgi:serine/threonine-protein kinase